MHLLAILVQNSILLSFALLAMSPPEIGLAPPDFLYALLILSHACYRCASTFASLMHHSSIVHCCSSVLCAGRQAAPAVVAAEAESSEEETSSEDEAPPPAAKKGAKSPAKKAAPVKAESSEESSEEESSEEEAAPAAKPSAKGAKVCTGSSCRSWNRSFLTSFAYKKAFFSLKMSCKCLLSSQPGIM